MGKPGLAAEFHCWYAQNRGEALRKGEFLHALYGKYLRTGSVVDLGCGEGALLLWLQQQGRNHLLGIESNPELSRLARSFGVPIKEADFLEYLQTAHPQPADYFYLDVVEHVPFESNMRLFGLLPVGSRLIIQTPYTCSVQGHEYYLKVPSHVAPYSPWVLEKMLTRFGYTTVEQGSIGGNLRSTWKNRLRAYLIRKVLGVDPELLMGGGNFFIVADRVRENG